MKRYEFDQHGDPVEYPGGEWIRYADHVEAMKRIAGDGGQQAEPAVVRKTFVFDGVRNPDFVPLRIEFEPGYPEDVAFGTQRQMDRLKKWLDKFFAMRTAQSASPAALTDALAKIGAILGPGDNSLSTLLVCIRNIKHFSDCLDAVEREFFMVPGEPDEEDPDSEPSDECLLNRWGSTVEQYVEQYRAAIPHLLAASPAEPRLRAKMTEASPLVAAHRAASPAAPDIPKGCEMTRNWCVSVECEGDRVLTISSEHVAGLNDLDPWASTIRGCAYHLLSFIGASPAALTDAQIREISREYWDTDGFISYQDQISFARAILAMSASREGA